MQRCVEVGFSLSTSLEFLRPFRALSAWLIVVIVIMYDTDFLVVVQDQSRVLASSTKWL